MDQANNEPPILMRSNQAASSDPNLLAFNTNDSMMKQVSMTKQ